MFAVSATVWMTGTRKEVAVTRRTCTGAACPPLLPVIGGRGTLLYILERNYTWGCRGVYSADTFTSVYEKRLFVSMSMDISRNGYDRGAAEEDIIDRTVDKYADDAEMMAFYGDEHRLRDAAADVADRWFESPHPDLVAALID